MPASGWELQQIKLAVNLIRQIIEAIEAREKVEQARPEQNGAPVARPGRIA
jgi:hypothetical protein